MKTIIEERAGDTLAPALVEFVTWILRSAGKENVRRIYFLSRDGYPMYLAAKILSKGREPSIECRYLRCSRYAWRLAAFHVMGREAAEQICIGGVDVTPYKIFRRGGLTDEEAAETAKELRLEKRLHTPMSYQSIQAFKPKLRRCERFWRYVSAHARKAYVSAMAYLKEQGLLEEGAPFAVADSGWTGTMQKTLETLLVSAGTKPDIEGYYFGLYQLPKDADFRGYHGYYFEPWGKLRRKVHFSNSFFECVFSESERMTIGYRTTRKGMAAVLEAGEVRNQEALGAVGRAVVKYARRKKRVLPRQMDKWKIKPARRAAARLSRLMARPVKAEAEAFGSLSFTDDVLEAGNHLAPPLSEKDIRDNHVLAKILAMVLGKGKYVKGKYIKESPWLEGSIVRGGRRVKYHLWQNRMYKYALYGRKSLLNLFRAYEWKIREGLRSHRS